MIDEDDKPTVVLDLAALKKKKIKQEEDLANLATELEFNVDTSEDAFSSDEGKAEESFSVILFDFQSKFFGSNQDQFPGEHRYVVARNLGDLNQHLRTKKFQLLVLNYDAHPKAINQLSAQVKKKFPQTRVIIMAKNISPKKAQLHAKTPSGAAGYCQFPLEEEKIRGEFTKAMSKKKRAA